MASFFIYAVNGGRHIKHAFRKMHTLTGFLIDDLIQQRQKHGFNQISRLKQSKRTSAKADCDWAGPSAWLALAPT